MKLKIYLALIIMTLFVQAAFATDTIVKVRFNNPQFNCTTQILNVDVEFQCNIANQKLYGINCRFIYPDSLLEFINFNEIATGYAATGTVPIQNGSGANFGYTGVYDFVNKAISKYGTPTANLSTTGWTKIFAINFHVDDVNAYNSTNLFSSLTWDLDIDQTGFLTPQGVVITLWRGGDLSSPTIEQVFHHNWQNDNILGLPFGFPVNNTSISTVCGYAPRTILPEVELFTTGPVDIPVKVLDFDNIGEFCLTFEYDTTVLTFTGDTTNSIFNPTNGYLNITDTISSGSNHKIIMAYDGLGITLPDSSVIAILTFNTACGSTNLNWINGDTSCYFLNNVNYPLWDLPYSEYYTNGSVELEVTAPVTKIDSTVATVGSLVTFAVKVWKFENIQSGSLTLDFDPDVLSFFQAIPNDVIAPAFTSQIIGSGRLTMSWTGSNTTLPDGSILSYLVFSNIGGSTPLMWFDTGASCQYISSITNMALNDLPTCDYYHNGNIAPSVFEWTGEVSNDWNSCGNWEYGVVPDKFTDVVINTSSGRILNPNFNGDFVVGEQCKNLTIYGNTQFSISGDLTIEPGHKVEMTGPGILQIGGDWTNSGIFIPGSGVVEFYGTTNSSIAQGVPPQNFVDAYILSTTEATMTQITGGTAGPTGDDAHSDVSLGFNFNYLGINYSQARINTNGWISLNLSGDDVQSANNMILFDTLSPTTVLAPWWDDLKADESSSITYKTEGAAPDRVFIVQWLGVLSFKTNSTARLNFQVKLYETTNVIEFCYGEAGTGTHCSTEGASIGIKDATGGQGNYLEASHYSTNLILPFLSSAYDWPEVNYLFTPPIENDEDLFYKMLISKTSGEVSIQRDVRVTGQE